MKDLILRISLLDNVFFTGIKVVVRSLDGVKMDAFREWLRVSGLELNCQDFGVAMVITGIMDSRKQALDVCADIQLLLEGQDKFDDVPAEFWEQSSGVEMWNDVGAGEFDKALIARAKCNEGGTIHSILGFANADLPIIGKDVSPNHSDEVIAKHRWSPRQS